MKKKWDEYETENPLIEDDYKYVPKEMLTKLLAKRLEHPDSNAGAIFIDLDSPLYQTTIEGLQMIMRSIKKQKLQVVFFEPLKDEDKLQQSSIINPKAFKK